jgi:bacteriorhodopsin
VIRFALGIVGLLELSLALPWLMGVNSWWVTDHHADASHLTRDGMLALVIATCALISASSRRYAFFCVVPATLAVVVQIMSGFYDDAHHRISSIFETIHIFHVVVFVLMLLELRAERSHQ